MKYRVVFYKGKFYPQTKFLLFFWVDCLEYDGEIDIHFTVSFDKLEQAVDYCEKQLQKHIATVVWSNK